MRLLTVLALVATLGASNRLDARLFLQTYGSTVATADGCAWNENQDYFVPRYCSSCRYDLFSACKSAHTTSPACKHTHAVYPGYCTPYGACRALWRDLVYKVHCGCTGQTLEHSPRRADSCSGPWLLSGPCGCNSTPNGDQQHAACEPGQASPAEAYFSPPLPHVEPFGGETLGSIAAAGAASAGGSVATSSAPAAPSPGPPGKGALPSFGLTPRAVESAATMAPL